MEAVNFYDRLPRHSIELIQGSCLISSSRQISRMVLAAKLQGYGASYIKEMIDPSLLQDALIEAYGRDSGQAWPAETYGEAVADLPLARMGSELRMNIYMMDRFAVMGRDQVIRIGEDALTPDIFICRDKHDSRQHAYFFDGAPELIIDFMHPATRDFDEKVRLPLYQKLGAAEIWLIDAESESIQAYTRQQEAYQKKVISGHEPLVSSALPGLQLHTAKLWAIKQNPWQNYRDLVSLEKVGKGSEAVPQPTFSTQNVDIKLPFSPDIRLLPTPISFTEFISWAPEAKFEWDNDRPHIGGGYETNLHLTGLLMMTFGLNEAVSMLPAQDWQALL
jgi:hypothetical protein